MPSPVLRDAPTLAQPSLLEVRMDTFFDWDYGGLPWPLPPLISLAAVMVIARGLFLCCSDTVGLAISAMIRFHALMVRDVLPDGWQEPNFLWFT